MANVNGMQANMGLSGGGGPPQGMVTPSPADTALSLSTAAAHQQQETFQIISQVPLGASDAFRRQFQQQLSQIQAQQSLNPYSAHVLSRYQPEGSQQYLPSPLAMTPASSGVFRPPAQRPSMAPVAPTYTPSFGASMFEPFTPQAPTPMFGSEYEQKLRQEDIRANRTYARFSQAPRALGIGAGIMAGAGVGALAGSALGPLGTLVGAGVGAVGAGLSGLATGVGDLAQMTMRPSLERHRMGAGLQRVSKNWVTTGSDVSTLGRGLTRDASLELAEQVQDLGSDSKFQKQTGEMFNSQDLMQITRQGGEAGLFDMSQEVPKIKEKIKETAATIKQFMELTNDASVTNVIRQMGRLQQFGLNQKEMITAAQGMRSYARAAGTSIEGLQQIGGLPGAATFQGVGLTAGQGFQYGNAAAASANQMVASGSVSQRQLALQGGVQGMAQRDMQAQAAFASMPLFAGSQSKYSEGSWGIDPDTAGRGDGAFGMVQGTMRSMNRAVQEGGVGALAMFQMKQKELSDTVLASMSPMQALKQRMSMAMSTGQRLGMTGEQALAVGGGVAFNPEVANSMSQRAKSPQFWETKRQAIRQRQLQLGVETAERNRANTSWFTNTFGEPAKDLGFTGAGSWGRKTSRALSDFGASFSVAGDKISTALGKGWDDHFMGTDVITSRYDAGVSGIKKAALRGDDDAFTRQAARLGKKSDERIEGGIDIDQDLLLQGIKDEKWTGVAEGEKIGNILSVIGAPAGDWGTIGSGAANSILTPRTAKQELAKRTLTTSTAFLNRTERAKQEGDSKKKYKQAYSTIETAMGEKGKDLGVDVVGRAAKLLDKRILEGKVDESKPAPGEEGYVPEDPFDVIVKSIFGEFQPTAGDTAPTEAEYRTIAVESMIASTKAGGTPMTRKEAEAQYDAMSADDKENFKTQITAKGREGSKNKEAYDDLEGTVRKNRADQIETATNQRIESLKDENYTRIEDDLNLDETLFGYTDRDKKVQDLAAEYGDEFGVMALLAAKKDGSGDVDKITKQLKDSGISSDRQADMLDKLKGFSEEKREMFEDIGATGVSLEDINEYGATTQATQAQSAYGSSGFMDAFGKYSKSLTAHLGAEGGKAISGKSVAQQFTKEERAKMSKYGGVEGRRMAKLVKQAEYEGADENKQKQALKAQGLITKTAVLKSKQDDEGVEKQSKVTAEGDEAKTLEKDMKAIDEMAAMFADFKPSIKEFEKGTKNLSAAMESEAMTRLVEGD